MEVICDRCNAEYEFDEALVAIGGTTVKCTNCGHLFKVYRNAASTARGSRPVRPWTVQYTDGHREELAALREVTSRILDGQLSVDDEISHTGRAFRKLGEIPELQAYFAFARSHAGRPRGTLVADVGAPAAVSGGGARSPGRGPVDQDPQGADEPLYSDRPETGPSARPTGARSGSWMAWIARHLQAARRVLAAEAGRFAVPRPFRRRARHNVRDEPGSRPASPQRRWPLALALALALLAAALGAYRLWLRPAPRQAPAAPEQATKPAVEIAVPTPGDVVSAAVELGDRVLQRHDVRGFPGAIAAFQAALPNHADDPRLLSTLSRLHAHWSQQLRFELDDIAANLHPDPPRDVAALAAQQRAHAGHAKVHAERAARRNPGHAAAEVALGDALRLAGNLAGARAELERARAGQGVRRGEILRVDALLTIAEQGGDMAAGLGLARRGVAGVGCGAACDVLLVRVLAGHGALSEARVALDPLARKAPDLPLVQYLRRSLDLRSRREARLRQRADALRTADRPPAASPPEEPPFPPASPRRQRAVSLCRRGETAFSHGQVGQAERWFARAADLEPNLPRIATGMGYVALERKRFDEALRLFRSATRRNYPDAYLGLGEVYRALEKRSLAMESYRTYLDKFPRGRGAATAQHELNALSRRRGGQRARGAAAPDANGPPPTR